MEKLTYDIEKGVWIVKKTPKSASPLQSDSFFLVLEMFRAGDFFYIIHIPEKEEIKFCSPGITQILGFKPEEIDFSFLRMKIHHEDLPTVKKFERSADEFLATKDPALSWQYKVQYDFRLKTKYGRFKRILYQTIPYPEEEGEGDTRLSVFTDISHLKKSNDQALAFVNLKGGTSIEGFFRESPKTEKPRLSKREKEILACFLEGKNPDEIAADLFISKITVNNHLKRIRSKTNIKSLVQLTAIALEENWIES